MYLNIFLLLLGRPMNIQLMDGPNGMKSPANPNKGNVRQRVGQQRGGGYVFADNVSCR